MKPGSASAWKWLIAAVVLLALLFGYWNFDVYRKMQFLTEFSKPFYVACQTSSGCVLSPEGWRKERGDIYAREMMEYSADKEKFQIIWHIATDVFLVAKGGRGKEVTVERVVGYPGEN